jgi:hypothetical protein
MTEEILRGRRKALEESFFAKQNEKLRRALREQDAAKAQKETLAAASGINDDAVLEELIALDIAADTVVALALVPLVEVAWADGSIDDKERAAILAAAEQTGLEKGGASHQLLQSWLAAPPDRDIRKAWKDYVNALCNTLSAEPKQALKEQVVGRARAVAEAAGGFLGLGSKVSSKEKVVLDELEQAFS